ncbi:MAG: hypothetical protein CSB44_05000 [Gammaproteobacteria bacterium]|nr:MAG: hypothetical protein CSB44_05000 [Gammaproteobacteria bacterium]
MLLVLVSCAGFTGRVSGKEPPIQSVPAIVIAVASDQAVSDQAVSDAGVLNKIDAAPLVRASSLLGERRLFFDHAERERRREARGIARGMSREMAGGSADHEAEPAPAIVALVDDTDTDTDTGTDAARVASAAHPTPADKSRAGAVSHRRSIDKRAGTGNHRSAIDKPATTAVVRGSGSPGTVRYGGWLQTHKGVLLFLGNRPCAESGEILIDSPGIHHFRCRAQLEELLSRSLSSRGQPSGERWPDFYLSLPDGTLRISHEGRDVLLRTGDRLALP